jgi:hypothetical protein
MSLEMAQKVIVPQKKNYVPQFLKQRDINSYSIYTRGEQLGAFLAIDFLKRFYLRAFSCFMTTLVNWGAISSRKLFLTLKIWRIFCHVPSGR